MAEYIGEYVSLAVTEAREKMYQEQRIQDYQFWLDDTLVIDATMNTPAMRDDDDAPLMKRTKK